jgi:hypothetical protein
LNQNHNKLATMGNGGYDAVQLGFIGSYDFFPSLAQILGTRTCPTLDIAMRLMKRVHTRKTTQQSPSILRCKIFGKTR